MREYQTHLRDHGFTWESNNVIWWCLRCRQVTKLNNNTCVMCNRSSVIDVFNDSHAHRSPESPMWSSNTTLGDYYED